MLFLVLTGQNNFFRKYAFQYYGWAIILDLNKWEILGLIAIGFLVYAAMASVFSYSDNSSTQPDRVLTEPVSAEEKAQLEKFLALEKYPEFLSAIDSFVKSTYAELYTPVIEKLIVVNMTSDTEAEVHLTVTDSSIRGEKSSITYHRNWTKSSGMWKAEDDFK